MPHLSLQWHYDCNGEQNEDRFSLKPPQEEVHIYCINLFFFLKKKNPKKNLVMLGEVIGPNLKVFGFSIYIASNCFWNMFYPQIKIILSHNPRSLFEVNCGKGRDLGQPKMLRICNKFLMIFTESLSVVWKLDYIYTLGSWLIHMYIVCIRETQ